MNIGEAKIHVKYCKIYFVLRGFPLIKSFNKGGGGVSQKVVFYDKGVKTSPKIHDIINKQPLGKTNV